jgi:hypothetical protein
MKSIAHDVGSVFQPIFHIVGWLLALCYDLIPNYAIAIVMLTIIIMAVLTPFTIKSTKSMMAMQKLQPDAPADAFPFHPVQHNQGFSEQSARTRQTRVAPSLHSHVVEDVPQPRCFGRTDQGLRDGPKPKDL